VVAVFDQMGMMRMMLSKLFDGDAPFSGVVAEVRVGNLDAVVRTE
jgi:hypothetical protein